MATTDPRFRAVLADLRSTHVARVAATVRRMQRDGVATRDLDPELAAAALCSMVEGFARNWFGRGETYDEVAATDTLTRLWARALQLPEPTATSTEGP